MNKRILVAVAAALMMGTALTATDVASPVTLAHAQSAAEILAGIDRRPASELELKALQRRFQTLRKLQKSKELDGGQRQAVQQMVGADLQELQRRKAEREAQQQQNKAATGEQQQEQTQQRKKREKAQEQQQQQQRQEQPKASASIGGAPASSLNDRQLKEQIRYLQQGLQNELFNRAQQKQAQALLQEYRAELARRQQQAQQQQQQRQQQQQQQQRQQQQADTNQPAASADLTRAMRSYLADAREPSGMNTGELRQRVTDGRNLLRERSLDRDQRDRIGRQFRRERDALRARLDQDRNRDVVSSKNVPPNAALLIDRRVPSSQLTIGELRYRIDVLSDAIDNGQFASRARRQIALDLIASDRDELRRKLRRHREDRFVELRNRRKRGDLNIVIGLNPFLYPTIAAAEYDDGQIEAQLIARPRIVPRQVYSLNQIEREPELREAMPGIEIDTLRFASGSALIPEEEIASIERIASILERIIAASPGEVFLIEGHTDAVGPDFLNDELSRKRAETVKQVLVEYYAIPPENLRTVGLGERFLKIPTPYDEAENRRVTVRRITPLLVRN